MKLSDLQKYILRQAWENPRKTVGKTTIERFYSTLKDKPARKDIITIITKSAERLIAKDLVTGFGHKTAKKWFITEIKLTAAGRKKARDLFGIQQKLPFHSKKKTNR